MKMKNKSIYTAFIGSALISILLLSSCGDKSVSNSIDEEPYCLDAEFKEKIEFAQAEKVHMTNEIHLTGVVEPNPENVISFSNLVDGIIVKANFSLGDYVQKGQVLAELKSTELTEWRSRQKSLAAELEVAESELTAVKSMFKDGISSQSELKRAESAVTALNSELEEITSNLALYNASSQSNVFLIKAPRSGYIIEKNSYPGMQVEAYGESLFTIAELSDVWVQINIYASDIQHVTEGMNVKIESLSYPDSLFTGKIEAISHVLDHDSKVIKARVNIENKNLLLKPGMFVNVYATKETQNEVLSIPLKSLIFDDNQNFVVLYKDDCNLEVRKVNYIGQNNGKCYLPLEDLDANDKVITKEQLLIYEQIKNF